MSKVLVIISSSPFRRVTFSNTAAFIDCEDQDIAEISVSQRLIDRYRQTLATFIEQARDFCSRRGIVYTMTSTERDVDRLVSRYLRQRGLVR